MCFLLLEYHFQVKNSVHWLFSSFMGRLLASYLYSTITLCDCFLTEWCSLGGGVENSLLHSGRQSGIDSRLWITVQCGSSVACVALVWNKNKKTGPTEGRLNSLTDYLLSWVRWRHVQVWIKRCSVLSLQQCVYLQLSRVVVRFVMFLVGGRVRSLQLSASAVSSVDRPHTLCLRSFPVLQ